MSALPTSAPARVKTPRIAAAISIAAAIGLPIGLFALILFAVPLLQPDLLDAFIRERLHHDPATWAGRDATYAVALVVLAFVFANFAAIFSGILSWWERRVAGRIQSRIGPNRAGVGGFLVWIADAVKLLLKEDLVPADADRILFRAAPYFVMTGFILTFVVLPFGESIAVTDMNVGLFYITSITALVVVGILLSGWSSNSKWALFGGMRSAAQVVSYEIPAGLAIMVPVLMSGTLSMQGIIRAQGGLPWEWFMFRNPAAFITFFIFFTSQLAEGNRTPFDLPEAESELVAGYLSEYSGFRFALFFLVEWGNLWVMAAVAVTIFLGGWQIPFVSNELYAQLKGTGFPPAAWWGLQAASMAVFALKTIFLVNVVVWIRWTLPRIRVDQMMSLCWKYLVPVSFVCFVFTLLWQIAVASVPALETAMGVGLTAVAVLLAVLFARQTHRNITAIGDRVDLSNW
ncbi:MAG TPA: NADH-quinone oxidoreductase subunit NuoH [Anaeromyxobacteraceae bacterium]|jgi:NADH-quinone oxidoreductase subunit H|nr:NADH-quinone oxidoreductase subunit NuoH [Anaeromyxobacteraceae bacterium]